MEHGKMLKLPCYMAKTTLNELHSAWYARTWYQLVLSCILWAIHVCCYGTGTSDSTISYMP